MISKATLRTKSDVPVVSAVRFQREALADQLEAWGLGPGGPRFLIGFERMIRGDMNGWLLSMVQNGLWEVIMDLAVRANWGARNVWMVGPYPNQLQGYIQKVHQGGKSKTLHRKTAMKLTGLDRVSSDEADAYFAARCARDVCSGAWTYTQAPTLPRLAPWTLIYNRPEWAENYDWGTKQ